MSAKAFSHVRYSFWHSNLQTAQPESSLFLVQLMDFTFRTRLVVLQHHEARFIHDPYGVIRIVDWLG
jgi:hypothetical protein